MQHPLHKTTCLATPPPRQRACKKLLMSTGYLCDCGISSAHSISAAVRSGSHDSPPGLHCALTALTWTQASVVVAAGLVANLFRSIDCGVPTDGLLVQRSRYAALQLLPIIMRWVLVGLDTRSDDFFSQHAATAPWPLLCWYALPSRAGTWLSASGGLKVHLCAGERVLGQQWSSRHRGGCLPRTHPPVLRPDRGRCAALPLATELLHGYQVVPLATSDVVARVVSSLQGSM